MADGNRDAEAEAAELAVNSVPLWDPLPASVAEVARVLRPGGRLVTLTHNWAIERASRATLDRWLATTGDLLTAHGFAEATHWRARAEGGRSIALVARRAPERAPADPADPAAGAGA